MTDDQKFVNTVFWIFVVVVLHVVLVGLKLSGYLSDFSWIQLMPLPLFLSIAAGYWVFKFVLVNTITFPGKVYEFFRVRFGK